MTWRNRRVVVVGLGRTGRAAVALLRRLGADVAATDDAPPEALGGAVAEVQMAGARYFGPGSGAARWEGADLCVSSPGVPWRAPVLEEARGRGIPVVSELELASTLVRGTLIAVTGTNGKSTTTSLAAHLLSRCGLKAVAGGNLGRPLSSMLEEDSPETHHVVECSSFQLLGCTTFRPRVSIFLNLTPDHLDVHGGMEEYRAAKTRIFRAQGPDDVLVYHAGDPEVSEAVKAAKAALFPFSPAGRPEGRSPAVWLQAASVWTDLGRDAPAPWFEAGEVPLLGRHNVENAMAAAAAAAALGCPLDAVRRGLTTFRPLAHRMQPVARARGILFVDDSKATNVDAAARAVETFPGGLHLILGGRDKGGEWASFRELLEGRVRGIYLLGEAAGLIAQALDGAAPMRMCATLDEAVDSAFSEAGEGETVLLAPGCSSFDMFRDYAHRGEVFSHRARDLAARQVGVSGGAS